MKPHTRPIRKIIVTAANKRPIRSSDCDASDVTTKRKKMTTTNAFYALLGIWHGKFSLLWEGTLRGIMFFYTDTWLNLFRLFVRDEFSLIHTVVVKKLVTEGAGFFANCDGFSFFYHDRIPFIDCIHNKQNILQAKVIN